jgi:ATP adenylyltransferase
LGYILGSEKTEPPSAPLKPLLPDADPQCFLCQGVPEGDDCQRLIVARSKHAITVLNRYPYNNGHLLVAPLRHAARLDRLSAEETMDIAQTVTSMVSLLEKTIKAQGFNVGLNLGREAGAGLPGHLHWHIVPRWHGDTNFMPVVAGARVIPQSLEALWSSLRDGLEITEQGLRIRE